MALPPAAVPHSKLLIASGSPRADLLAHQSTASSTASATARSVRCEAARSAAAVWRLTNAAPVSCLAGFLGFLGFGGRPRGFLSISGGLGWGLVPAAAELPAPAAAPEPFGSSLAAVLPLAADSAIAAAGTPATAPGATRPAPVSPPSASVPPCSPPAEPAGAATGELATPTRDDLRRTPEGPLPLLRQQKQGGVREAHEHTIQNDWVQAPVREPSAGTAHCSRGCAGTHEPQLHAGRLRPVATLSVRKRCTYATPNATYISLLDYSPSPCRCLRYRGSLAGTRVNGK